MLAKRIIPCLDVTGGRVVKGVNFVELRDAGDPVEIAAPLRRRGRRRTHVPRHHRLVRPARHHPARDRGGRRAGLHPADGRRRRAPCRGRAPAAECRRRQDLDQHRRRAGSGARRGSQRPLRRAVHRRGDRRPSQAEGRPRGRLGGLHARRPHADRPRRDRLGAPRHRARRRARSCSPAWTATERGKASISN